jgi:transcriptional regulator GlxA family with amidase domain
MTKRIGFVLIPGFQILDLAAVSTFELANGEPGGPAYAIELLSEHGGPVTSSSGVRVETQAFGDPRFDTVLVTGALDIAPASPAVLAFLREASAVSRRIASICTGAQVLAAAGLLNGKHATTHWCYAPELQRSYPKIKVDQDRIFINDGALWTSAGMTACIDMTLALVEADLGREVSRAIAKTMVVYHRRSGGQSQFSALLELEPKSDRIQAALSYAKSNLRKDLSVDLLAEAAHLGRRQFSRSFRSETGQSPARAIEQLRVESARAMIESGSHPIEVVARENGFSDAERMRRAFLRAFGQPPQAIKRAARAE